jgi:alkanesulfonate monooxygenase SsuD/methylene tetrahydromethanopterin reductase-like flavin-dependent oxidoreductase (luciferase family)
MQFVFLSEADTRPGITHATRYWELVEQVLHAERWGFDCFGVSEQHLAIGAATTASPEVLYGYLYSRTSRIRFRHAISLIPVNHPLKLAANVAVADILSHGRIELGVGRGNTTLSLRAFEIDLDKSRGKAVEGIQVLKKAFTQDPFMHYGEHYKIPPRSLVPKTLQKPYPPIFMAASSPDSHVSAGDLGIGVLSLSNFQGWKYLQDNVASYKKQIAKASEAGYVNNSVGVLVHAYCSESDESAKEEAGAENLDYVHLAYTGYPRLAKMSKDYAYMGNFAKLGEKLSDYDYFQNDSAAAVFGSPETCIKQIERYRAAGANELLLRIDSVPHDKIMKSIEMFGKYVIPHFRYPENIVRPADEILGKIRKMREEAKASGVYVELAEEKASA